MTATHHCRMRFDQLNARGRRGTVGKGKSHVLRHPKSGKEIWVAAHTKKEVGRLGNLGRRPRKAATTERRTKSSQ